MKRVLLTVLGIFLVLFLAINVTAADFTPQGNINMRGIYNLTGAPFVNATLFYGNGSQLTGIGFDWNKTYADTLYYGINNPSGFYNSTDFNIDNYLLISNWNATNETYAANNDSMKNYVDEQNDSQTNYLLENNQSVENYIVDTNSTLASWVDNLFVRFTELVDQVGNWSADQGNYYNSTEVDAQNTSQNNWILENNESVTNAIADVSAYDDAWINGTIDLKDIEVNDSMKNYVDTQNTSQTNFINANNNSVNNYILAVNDTNPGAYNDGWINGTIDVKILNNNNSVNNYIDFQDLDFNNSINNWITDQYYTITQVDTINTSTTNYILENNDSVNSYIDTQNSSQTNYILENNNSVNNYIVDYSDSNNDSMKNYLDTQNTSQTNYLLENNGSVNNFILYTNSTAADYTDSKLITTFFNATNVNPVTGTPAGTVVDLRDKNDISYNVTEVSSDMELIINFTSIDIFNQVIYRYKSDATESHMVSVQIWEYSSSSWENFDHLGNTENEYVIRTATIYDYPNHVSGGVVQVRFYTNNAGGSTHLHQFDWVSISKGAATPSAEETDPHAIHSDGMVSFIANWDQGAFNLTNVDSWFLGLIQAANVNGLTAFIDAIVLTNNNSVNNNIQEGNDSINNWITDAYYTSSEVDVLNTSQTNYIAENNDSVNNYILEVNATNPGGGGAGTITGTGTTWYIPLWNGTTSLNNSVLFQNGSNIGIGTTTPGNNLEVIGKVNIYNPATHGEIYIGNNNDIDSDNLGGYLYLGKFGAPQGSGLSVGAIYFESKTTDSTTHVAGVQANIVAGNTTRLLTTGNLDFTTKGTGANDPISRLRIDENGNIGFGGAITDFVFTGSDLVLLNGSVGIGTILPNATLHVVGDILANGTINATIDVCIEGGNCLSNPSSYDDAWINGTIDLKDIEVNDSMKNYVDSTFLTSFTELDPEWSANYSTFLENNISLTNYVAENNNSVNNYILEVNATNNWINTNAETECSNAQSYLGNGTCIDVIALDADTTYTAGTGLSLAGTEFSHFDSTTQGNSSNSDLTFIQDILLDSLGHIQSITAAVLPTATPSNGDTTHVSTADQIYDWATSIFLQSIVTDTSPQLGGYLDANGQNIGSTTDEIENIYVGDTTRIYFGDGQDASIYFNGTALIIG